MNFNFRAYGEKRQDEKLNFNFSGDCWQLATGAHREGAEG
jgi:hypothetical protein